MTMLEGKLTYANVMATVAVFIALGGGAYAATHLSKNSVGSDQIKRNAVTRPKVKNASLTGADIRDRSLGERDFKAGQVPTALGYAHIDHGDLDVANSKGVVGIEGAINFNGDPAASYVTCFNLAFTPKNISVTAQVGSNAGGNHPALDVSGIVPGLAPTISSVGCPPGFRDAEVDAPDVNEGVSAGVFVLFN